jgi:hypothetical protein
MASQIADCRYVPSEQISLLGAADGLGKSPGLCLHPGPSLNVHKIRGDSDNKRCARCVELALTRFRRLNI